MDGHAPGFSPRDLLSVRCARLRQSKAPPVADIQPL
jgi:hypothetical protein